MTPTPTSRHSNSTSDPLGSLLELLWGFVPSRSLVVAAQSGLFEQFGAEGEDEKSLEDIHTSLGWAAQPTQAFLGVLRSGGLLTDVEGVYSLTPTAKRWLRRSSPNSILPYLERLQKLELSYEQLLTVLVTGSPIELMRKETKAAFGLNRAATQDFVMAMHAVALEFGEELAAEVSRFLPSDQPCRILDVGCGRATLSEILCNRFPFASVDAFDLSGVSEWAKSYVKTSAVSTRIAVHTADWQQWRWEPKAYDLILLSQVLHEFDNAQTELLFGKACGSIAIGGFLSIVLVGNLTVKDGDLLNSVFSLNMLVEVGGINPSLNRLDTLARDQRVERVALRVLPGGRTVWIGKRSN